MKICSIFSFVFFVILLLTVKVLAQDEIKIGWIGPLTGNSAALGVDSVEVARQIFAKANNDRIHTRKFKLIVEDDQYQTGKTLTSYNRLAHVEHVQVIFVLTYGGMLAISQLAEKDNIILINPLDCDEELAALPKNSFCVAKKTEDLGISNAFHAIKHKNLPAAIIYFDGDPFPVKVAKATNDILEKEGTRVVLFEGVNSNMKDFRSLLLRVKTTNAKALFVYGYDDFGLLLNQARQLGIEAVFYSVPGAGVGTDGFNKAAGDAVNGIFASGWFAPRTDAYTVFITNYISQVGRKPILEVSTIPTHDMAKILIAGLAKTDDKNDSLNISALREYLYQVKNYNGLSGTITIDADGAVRTLPVGMYSFNHGNFKSED